MIGHLDEVIRPIVLGLPKIFSYVKFFNNKDRNKDKNNKLISFPIDDDKLLENIKRYGQKVEDLQNTELNCLAI